MSVAYSVDHATGRRTSHRRNGIAARTAVLLLAVLAATLLLGIGVAATPGSANALPLHKVVVVHVQWIHGMQIRTTVTTTRTAPSPCPLAKTASPPPPLPPKPVASVGAPMVALAPPPPPLPPLPPRFAPSDVPADPGGGGNAADAAPSEDFGSRVARLAVAFAFFLIGLA